MNAETRALVECAIDYARTKVRASAKMQSKNLFKFSWKVPERDKFKSVGESASGTQRIDKKGDASLKVTNIQRIVFVTFSDSMVALTNVGMLPTLLNSSLSATKQGNSKI